MSVRVKNLTKIYGEQKAVDDISFQIKEGEIVGFLGPNGAGKSTTMKIATCYIPPTSGEVIVDKFDVVLHPLEVRKVIGYLPEHNPLYLDMYVHEYLGFIGSLHQLSGKRLREGVKSIIEMCGLTLEQNKKIGALSKGYRQRVGLAQSLIHDPKVLILDEPTTGLDPNQLAEIRQLIKQISHEKTVIFSTHIMQEVQAICNRVIIINQGKIVADSPVSELKGEEEHVTYLIAEFTENVDLKDLIAIEGVIDVAEQQKNQYVLKTNANRDIRAEIFKFATTNNKVLLEMREEKQSLENVFQKLTGRE
ncbi:gliding motility-associated ABC transporter ATP-binding subunit GldA [Fulvivirgaceae bacterium BMA12]|uniref:Gliding motility-associated ABC transporter ATP-binding subunit GldA n=1 Tax=Agaribacillus aureus TaxID=3051825 RepID=A0ABT8L6M9_9BACT|nr:gliding motility-associated ABC transporter ATP-binding subunit GldA [Fulvivirgaceae bacterium BMA12]